MIVLNIHNTEDLIFYNAQIKKILPDFIDLFNQWAFSKQNVGFQQLTKRTVSDFLEKLQEEHLDILKRYFKTEVAIDNMDYHIIKNVEMNCDCAELKAWDGFNFSAYRTKDRLYVTFWR